MARANRRAFLGAAGLAAAGAAVACSPFSPAGHADLGPGADARAPAPSRRAGRGRRRAPPRRAGGSPAPAATSAPAARPSPPTAPAAAPAIRYADKAVVHRYLTGGYSFFGPDDPLVKQIQEEALRKEYGLNVQINYESASWADIDALMDVRLQTQGDRLAAAQPQPRDALDLDPRPDPRHRRRGQAVRPEPAQGLPEGLLGVLDARRQEVHRHPGPAHGPGRHRVRAHPPRLARQGQPRRSRPRSRSSRRSCKLFRDKKLGGAVTIPFIIENPLWLRGSTLMGPWVPEPVQQLQMLSEGRPLDRGAAVRRRAADACCSAGTRRACSTRSGRPGSTSRSTRPAPRGSSARYRAAGACSTASSRTRSSRPTRPRTGSRSTRRSRARACRTPAASAPAGRWSAGWS